MVHRSEVTSSYSTTNKMHLLSQIIYSCKTLYTFRAVFLSIISSSKLRIQQRYMSNSCCYLLLAAGSSNTTQRNQFAIKISSNKSGVYQLTCNDCGKIYTGQTGRSFEKRFTENCHSFKNSNHNSKFLQHGLENCHLFGKMEDIMRDATLI